MTNEPQSARREDVMLPCPFCGSSDVVPQTDDFDNHVIHCSGCGAEGPNEDTDAEAERGWNGRATNLPPATDYSQFLG